MTEGGARSPVRDSPRATAGRCTRMKSGAPLAPTTVAMSPTVEAPSSSTTLSPASCSAAGSSAPSGSAAFLTTTTVQAPSVSTPLK